MKMLSGFFSSIRMSLHDYWHERLLSSCAIMALGAVLAPILILFGIRHGIISTMISRLVEDPRNLEVSPVGSGAYSLATIKKLREMDGVAFVIPTTRSISATITLSTSRDNGIRSVVTDLVPTAKGDPLLEKWGSIPAQDMTMVLSESAATKLGIKQGESVTGKVGRSRQGIREATEIRFQVAVVLPLEAQQKDVAFVTLPMLEALEDYRDGRAVPEFGWPGDQRPPSREYSSFRLYAQNLDAVGNLRKIFISQNIDVYTRAEEIETVKNLDAAFTTIFSLITLAAALGFLASTASNMLAHVNRKRRHLGIIRLLGFPTSDIVLFPLLQAALTGFLGVCLASLVYCFVSLLINKLFASRLVQGEMICRLEPEHFFATMCLVMFLSIMASAYAAYRASQIDPSEVIRDV